MHVKSIIEEIETYLELYPLNIKKVSASPWSAGVKTDRKGMTMKNVSLFSEAHKLDEALHIQLESMDDNMLDQLVDEQGEESPVGQIIRRKRADAYSRVSCVLEGIEDSLQQEIKKAKAEGNQFYQTICYHIERLGYKSDADFYNSINMPRQQFSRLRDPSNTLSKKTVLWIIVALRLDYDQACDLLQKAGYRFRKGDMRDVILMYIFRNTTYDLYEVNQILEHFGVAPLG